jgi:hypothetical protein
MRGCCGEIHRRLTKCATASGCWPRCSFNDIKRCIFNRQSHVYIRSLKCVELRSIDFTICYHARAIDVK